MRFSDELVRHAIRLLGNPPQPGVRPSSNVDLRRAVSASYYALFHHLSEAGVEQIAPAVPAATANRVHRWFDHSEMKKICGEFSAPRLNPPLRELLEGGAASDDMRLLAANFIRLQVARHSADYDLDYEVSWQQAREFVEFAVAAIGAFERIRTTAEGNVFILSLLLWKNWQRER